LSIGELDGMIIAVAWTQRGAVEAARFLASSTIIAAVYRLFPIRTPPKKSGTGLPTAM
jgi:hypothetical protein